MTTRLVLGLGAALAALLSDVAALVALYDLARVPELLGGSWAHGLSSFAKVATLAALASGPAPSGGTVHPPPPGSGGLRGVFAAARLLSLFLALSLALALFSPEGWVAWLLAIVAWLLVAAGWMYVSGELTRAPDGPLQGYRQPLAVGALVIGIAMLLYVFDTPRLAGHVLFDVALAGACAASLGLLPDLTKRLRVALYVATLAVPGIAFLAPALGGIGAILYENRERIATLGTESAPVETAASLDGLLDERLPGLRRVHHTPVLQDVWLFADGRAMAVDQSAVLERADGSEAWTVALELQLSVPAEYLRFDRSGLRGIVGAHFEDPLRSLDGGRTWTSLETERIYASLRGREPGGGLLDGRSVVFLDPDTQRGSFVMDCRFFTTSDFGETWSMTELVDEDGKTRCPTDSPFAVDADLGVARASTLGSEYVLLREAPEGPWRVQCVIDFEAVLAVGDQPDCSEPGALTEAQRAAIDRVERESEIVARQVDDVFDPDLAGGTLRDNGASQWLSGPGVLARVEDGDDLRFDVRVPRLSQILAIDDLTALGVAESGVYATSDGGRRWRPLPDGLVVLPGDRRNGEVHLVDEEALWRFDSGELRRVSDLPPDLSPRAMRATPDGTERALLGWSSMLRSSNAGVSWRTAELPTSEERLDEYGDPWQPELAAFDCRFDGEPSCAGVFDDGTTIAWPLDDPEDRTELADAVLEDDYASGTLAILGQPPSLLYLPGGTSRLQRLDTNGGTETTRVGIVFDEFDRLERSAARDRVAIQQDVGRVLLASAEDAHLFDESSWREETSGLDASRVCWSETGEAVVLTSPDARVAVSSDSGASWSQIRTGGVLGSACGIAGEWLWLLSDGLSVYRRER